MEQLKYDVIFFLFFFLNNWLQDFIECSMETKRLAEYPNTSIRNMQKKNRGEKNQQKKIQ